MPSLNDNDIYTAQRDIQELKIWGQNLYHRGKSRDKRVNIGFMDLKYICKTGINICDSVVRAQSLRLSHLSSECIQKCRGETTHCFGIELHGCWSCVCISGCVKHGVKSYCVKVWAADPSPVVTVAWSFCRETIHSKSALHPSHKRLPPFMGAGWGVCHWINNEGSGTSQTSLNSFSGRQCRWHREFWGFLC